MLRLTRLSNDRHRFEYRRPDGSGEAVEMETRSLLLHDLVHFAVESEAQLQDAFYGRLARSRSYRELKAGVDDVAGVERVVVLVQGAVKTELAPEQVWTRCLDAFAAMAETPPDWLTPELVARVMAQLHALLGEWRATPFGQALELRFPLPD